MNRYALVLLITALVPLTSCQEVTKTHPVVVSGMKYSDVRIILAKSGAEEIPSIFAGGEAEPHAYKLKNGTFLVIYVFKRDDIVVSLGRCEKEDNPNLGSNWKIVDQVIP